MSPSISRSSPTCGCSARTDHTAPYAPVTSPDKDRMKAATIEVLLQGLKIDDGNTDISSPAVLTVKTLAGGVVARQAFTVEHVEVIPSLLTLLQGSTTLSSFTPVSNTTYYIDVSVAEPDRRRGRGSRHIHSHLEVDRN